MRSFVITVALVLAIALLQTKRAHAATYTTWAAYNTAALLGGGVASSTAASNLQTAFAAVCDPNNIDINKLVYTSTWGNESTNDFVMTCSSGSVREADTCRKYVDHQFRITAVCRPGDYLSFGSMSLPTIIRC